MFIVGDKIIHEDGDVGEVISITKESCPVLVRWDRTRGTSTYTQEGRSKIGRRKFIRKLTKLEKALA